MTLIREEKYNRIVADEGKHIRVIDDVFEPAHYDEDGNWVEDYFPYYFIEAYVPKKVNEENMYDSYVEEKE